MSRRTLASAGKVVVLTGGGGGNGSALARGWPANWPTSTSAAS